MFRWLRRIFMFFFSMTILVLFLYLLGNRQEFLDSTQFMLLKMITAGATISVFIGFFTMVTIIVLTFHTKRIYLGEFTLILLTVAISAVIVMVVNFLDVWFKH